MHIQKMYTFAAKTATVTVGALLFARLITLNFCSAPWVLNGPCRGAAKAGRYYRISSIRAAAGLFY